METLGLNQGGTVNPAFWAGKKVFVTGHTGFKGGWLCIWLMMMGARVKGFSLDPPTSPSLFEEADVADGMDSETGDIRDGSILTESMLRFQPDIVIHMAAQSLVRPSYSDPVSTYETNVMGTINVLQAVRQCDRVGAIINITTDKCYENREWEWGYRENDPMGGYDPYSSSKGCAELLTSAWRQSYFGPDCRAQLASARAGNVIGGGDWAKDRLVPDILRAFEKSQPVVVRSPQATRPWQHVLEPLSGYLVLAERLYIDGNRFAEGWNFGPLDDDARSVSSILDAMVDLWGTGAKWTLDTSPQLHEATYLKLDISKARRRLNWRPVWSLDAALTKIVSWHRNWLDGLNMRSRCEQEILEYIQDANAHQR